MRAVACRADIRQLPQRLYQPHSARSVDCLPTLTMSALPGIDSVARQRSPAQLDHPAWTMPRLWTTHLSPLSGSRTGDGDSVCGLLRSEERRVGKECRY